MARVKRGVATKKRHKRLLKKTKGFWGQRSNVFRRARETLLRAMAYAFVGRKQKKRNYRQLFITRISAACKEKGGSYSQFIDRLNKANIALNRKILSQLAVYDKAVFDQVYQKACN